MAENYRIREVTEGIELALHVQPRAKQNEISGTHGGALKVRLTAPPVDDAANKSLVEYFAALLGLPKSGIRITGGLRSRDKTILIRGISLAQVRSCLRRFL